MPLDALMLWLSNWGVAIPILCVLLTRDRKAIRVMLLSLLLTWGVSSVLKAVIARPRPFENGSAKLIGTAPTGSSFPSQHAAISFSAATGAMLFHRILGWIALLSAALVAYSRVYLGVHYWSDVVAGAVLGSAVTYCSAFLIGRLEQRAARKAGNHRKR